MRTTNILLGIIAILLCLHLFKGTEMNLFSRASAQPTAHKNKVSDTLNVRIVDVQTGTFSGSLPVLYGTVRTGFVLPVDKNFESNPSSIQTKVLPVALSH